MRAILGTIFLSLAATFAAAEEPLRIFIRSGPKTHEAGAHDYPVFLRDWTRLLNDRGARANGADRFPSQEELAQTDVLVLHAEEAGNIDGDDRKNFEDFLKRGGGVVAVHGGAVSRDPDWFKTVTGGSWRFGKTKWLEGHLSLYFTDRENPVTHGVSNFDLDDEIYYDMDLLPEVNVLAAAYTPKPKNQDHAGGEKRVNIYDIQPQAWTYEKDGRRAFTMIPGHRYENFSHNSIRVLLLRGIAWAGKRENADEFCKAEELGDALRYPVGGPLRAEDARKKIEVHPEFDISLVAAEPLINKAMNLDWDEKGRLWVAESPEYPNGLRKANTDVWKESGSKKPGRYEREPEDRISILTDTNGDGVMDQKQVFADKLELVTGFVFYKNGVIVCAAPDIWFLEDTDGDEVADRRTKLYTGLGTFDTHAVMNNLRWGLDGWIYATHGYSAGDVTALGGGEKSAVRIGAGVVRFKPDGSEIEMYSSKNGNTWGLCMTSDGQCFWTQPTSGTLFFHTVLPEYVLAKGGLPGTSSWHGMITQQKVFPKITREQLAYVQIDLVGSYTAAAGCAIYEGGAWPEKWNYSYFTGEPTVNLVSHYFVKPDGVTYRTEKEKGREETEFIRSDDLWFRPIETRVGPDGALYLIDFYNQAVIHNDTRGPLHGPANAAVRPDRDHYFGRIWKVQHKQAKKIEVPVLDGDKAAGLIKASGSPNAHTRMTALRLLREKGLLDEKQRVESGSQAYRAYLKGHDASTEDRRKAVLDSYLEAKDDWTRSAWIAAATDHALDFTRDILASPRADEWADLLSAIVPGILREQREENALKLIQLSADSSKAANHSSRLILDEILKLQNFKLPMTPDLEKAIVKLLERPATEQPALALVSRWDTGEAMQATIQKRVGQMLKDLSDRGKPDEQRIAIADALLKIGGAPAVSGVRQVVVSDEDQEAVQQRLIELLGSSARADVIAGDFAKLKPSLRGSAFDAILKQPKAAIRLLEAVSQGDVSPADLGPGNVARLRSHPSKQVADRANAMAAILNPDMKAKDEIISRLLPEVSKPGNAENGKTMYAAACAICHRHEELGNLDVGPPLTGMGTHSAAELLVHIVDPNREVDPSFWQWNITTRKGETLAGVITSENAASITLRNQGGDVEVRKDEIVTRENTHRSLMPEGLDGLGAEVLRDIISYMAGGEERYRVLDLRNAYTADSRRGLFADVNAKQDSVFPTDFGNITVEKTIPFFLMDPNRSANGLNLIVLQGGGKGNVAKGYPRKVEVPVDLNASRFYLLSGIAGWGHPATRDQREAMKLTLEYQGGTRQEIVMRNGIEFGDYIRETEVPGSKLLQGVVKRGQLRLISVEADRSKTVERIFLESYDNGVTPIVVAITADLSQEPAEVKTTAPTSDELDANDPKTTAPTGQKFKEPRSGNALRVLLAGAGSSHDFPRYFLRQDTEILKEAGGIDVAATPNLAETLALMKQADVLVFSGNDDQYGTDAFQQALNSFADAGKGVVILHAATWHNYPPETNYNKRFVGGGTKSHGKGEIDVTVRNPGHPVMKGVSRTFKIEDESYHIVLDGEAATEVLADNGPDEKTKVPHPAVWTVNDPKTRIVCITYGHDDLSHGNPDFQKILVNAVRWVGEKK